MHSLIFVLFFFILVLSFFLLILFLFFISGIRRVAEFVKTAGGRGNEIVPRMKTLPPT